MITPFDRGADPRQDLQLPLPYVEAAHAACEIDDDESQGEDPLAFKRGVLMALKVVLAGALILWLCVQWAVA